MPQTYVLISDSLDDETSAVIDLKGRWCVVSMGENVISVGRLMTGATNPKESAPGTIRGDFAVTVGKNIIHGSDAPESAVREIGLFFKEEELVTYDKSMNNWIN